MATAKLTINHDYLTLRVTFADRARLNLTISRSGEKASGTVADLRTPFDAFCRFMAVKNTGNYAERMARVEQMAIKAETPADLTAALMSAL